MKLKTLVGSLALVGIATHATVAYSQTTAQNLPTAAPQRIEITGSSIKRIQTEGALPVQTITRDEIQQLGIVSAEQLLARIAANGTGADNLSSNVGIQLGTTDRNNNGNSSANLRGLGANSTLVLLNGHRVVNHGAKGNAVDLNSIPLGAIERVEVLKDGASAIYGTDAIGGVINFILRKEYNGLEATAFADVTEAGGGNIYRGQLIGGFGNLASDRYNVFAALTVDTQKKLGGYGERDFANGFQPERGLSPDTTGTPFATQTGVAGTAIGASYRLPSTGTQTYNRANLLSFQGQCDTIPFMSQYQSALWGSPGARNGCAYDYGGAEVLIQPIDRVSLVSRGTFTVNNDLSLFAEFVGSHTKSAKSFEPYQITTTGSFAGAQYPVGGPYYQDLSAYIPSFDNTKKIAYRYRCEICGNRNIETKTDAYQLRIGAEGVLLGKYDYQIGLAGASSKVDSTLGQGYLYTGPMVAALATGLINPWLRPARRRRRRRWRWSTVPAPPAAICSAASRSCCSSTARSRASSTSCRPVRCRLRSATTFARKAIVSLTASRSPIRSTRRPTTPSFRRSSAISMRSSPNWRCRSSKAWKPTWRSAPTTTATSAPPPTRRYR